MSPIRIGAACTAGLLLSAVASAQQNDATTQGRAAASMVPALAVQKSQDLVLGEFRPGASIGTVNLEVGRGNPSPPASRTATGGVTLAMSPFSAAQFAVTGPAGASIPFSVSLPSGITLVRIGGEETMSVDAFRSNVNPDCGPGASATACPGSPYTLSVGATLHVQSNQIAGRYVGSFTITVNQL